MIGFLRLRKTGDCVDDLYKSFFTGVSRRGGEYPSEKDYRFNYKEDRPLHLYKNIFRIGKLFSIGFKLILAEEILAELGPLRCTVEPVVFDRPYWLEYDTNLSSFDHFGFKDWRVGQKKLFSQPGDPSRAEGLRYFAVFPRKDNEILSERLNLTRDEVDLRIASLSATEVLELISMDEIEGQGIIYIGGNLGGWVLSSRVNQVFKTAIDTYFMEITPLGDYSAGGV